MIKDTAEYALVIALLGWKHEAAYTTMALIMRGEKVPARDVNDAVAYIERHPVLDTLEQDLAIELLKKHADSSYCPF